MKKCVKCGSVENGYNKAKTCIDGFSTICKICTRKAWVEYSHSMTGVITKIWNNQVNNTKRRNMSPPNYTKRELIHWLYDNGFVELYREYRKSGYVKDKVPSCDRLDDYQSYSLGSLRLVTWRENYMTAHKDRTSGVNNKHSKAVDKFTLDGVYVESYWSMAKAERENGLGSGMVSCCCHGQITHAGNFIYKLGEENRKQRALEDLKGSVK